MTCLSLRGGKQETKQERSQGSKRKQANNQEDPRSASPQNAHSKIVCLSYAERHLVLADVIQKISAAS